MNAIPQQFTGMGRILFPKSRQEMQTQVDLRILIVQIAMFLFVVAVSIVVFSVWAQNYSKFLQGRADLFMYLILVMLIVVLVGYYLSYKERINLAVGIMVFASASYVLQQEYQLTYIAPQISIISVGVVALIALLIPNWKRQIGFISGFLAIVAMIAIWQDSTGKVVTSSNWDLSVFLRTMSIVALLVYLCLFAAIAGTKIFSDRLLLALANEKEAREEADLQRRIAEVAQKTESQFLASMSHELRTPLNAILGYTEAMAIGMVKEEQKVPTLNRVIVAAKHLLELINDLLDIEKVKSGTLHLSLKSESPAELIPDVAKTLQQSLAEPKGLSLKVIVTEECPVSVLTDRKKLIQILTNLVGNAIKYTQKGGVEVTVSAIDSQNWSLAVKDTGIGMSTEDLSRVFEMFYQVADVVQEPNAPKSTGLGLAITQQLVGVMGGTIIPASEKGVGSTFTVILPTQPKVEPEQL